MEKITMLRNVMIEWEMGEPKRMQHFFKVHTFAKLIAESENVKPDTLYTLEVASLVADVGVKLAKAQDFRAPIELQDKEGVVAVKKMLLSLGFNGEIIERVCFMVGNRRDLDNIKGMDFRILIEAEYLVNLYEQLAKKESFALANKKVFKTKTGTTLFRKMYANHLEEII